MCVCVCVCVCVSVCLLELKCKIENNLVSRVSGDSCIRENDTMLEMAATLVSQRSINVRV